MDLPGSVAARRAPWVPGALLLVVVALAAGIVAMHVLTSSHDTHTGAPSGWTTTTANEQPAHQHAAHESTAHESTAHESTAHESTAHESTAHESTGASGEHVVAAGATRSTAPPCDDGCTAGLTAMCLAVLAAGFLLLPCARGLRAAAPRPASATPVPPRRSLSLRPPAPDLLALCVSRT